ncbi:hypothetical protein [Confluentibacter sediminis]|uniref:hypothetical protein n=1 Tax=Confluentibacter sediminis TaxID=2219045 RepID=UPI000DAC0FBB|nr:hypothetical protein [Confluentibacter sediminis]
MKGNEYYRFYECCRIVKGVNRTIIYDLQRSNFYYIPNPVIEIFINYLNKSIDSLFYDYSSQKEELEKYFNYLLTNELIFVTNNPEPFSSMGLELERPHKLDFIFIEIDDLQDFKIDFLKKSVDKTGVDEIIIINSTNSIENFNMVLNLLSYSRVKLVTFISLFHDNLVKPVMELKTKHERLKKIVFIKSPLEYAENGSKDNKTSYFTNSLKDLLTRGIEKMEDFVMNKNSYLESLNYNLYYNRRIYINNIGKVKPSYIQKEYYGNIEYENINDIVLKDGFRDLWKVTKDKIEICRDCEFRYMCPDNRIPVKKKNIYYHKSLCNYDPYTNLWKN